MSRAKKQKPPREPAIEPRPKKSRAPAASKPCGPREIPYTFSAPMMLALLQRRKTQTRRVLDAGLSDVELVGVEQVKHSTVAIFRDLDHGKKVDPKPIRVAYRAKVGDLAWTREAWRTLAPFDEQDATQIFDRCRAAGYTKSWMPVQYMADGHREGWAEVVQGRGVMPGRIRQPRHMPRALSRVQRRITAIRFEQLHAITEADVIAEGIQCTLAGADGTTIYHLDNWPTSDCTESAIEMLKLAWNRINGRRLPWEMNPWLAVVELGDP